MKKIRLRVNGTWRELIVDAETVLLEVLREDLRLTGAKQSCDRKGQCGACTVVVNGKAVRSCLTRASDLEGADVITVEGLGTPDNPHLIQEAFVLSGAIQCGFCTPGMIMATKALLDTDPNPSIDAIKHALRRNLCRCTGYKKIVEAVQSRRGSLPLIQRLSGVVRATNQVGIHPEISAVIAEGDTVMVRGREGTGMGGTG
jgi:aldehyde oxidoreductase